MQGGRHITAILPARNEEASLPGVVARMPFCVDRVVVVDNGSQDRSAEVARRAGAEVCRENERGYGAACWRGFRYAREAGADLLVFLDADGSDDPRDLPLLLEPLLGERAELAIGHRCQAPAMPWHQRAGTRLVCGVLSAGFGVPVRDIAPFRAIAAESLEALDMRDRRYGWTAEMQARALRRGLRCTSVDVGWQPGTGRSEISGTLRGSARAGYGLLYRSLREIARARLDGNTPAASKQQQGRKNAALP